MSGISNTKNNGIGILFLTTNRVGAIDDAFRSRLHLTLYFPRLDAAKSKKVWKVNIRRMKDGNEDRKSLGLPEVQLDEKRILKYAELNFDALHWNGRQIRNAFQSALALAEFKLKGSNEESPLISVKEFEAIAAASNEFETYMQATHGLDEEKMAKRDRMRGDYRPPPEKKLKSLAETESSSDSESTESSSGDSEAPKKRSKKSSKKKPEKFGSRKVKEESDSADKKKRKKKTEKGKGKGKKESEEDSSDSDTDND